MNPDADLWERLTANGMKPDAATAYVREHSKLADADAWERLTKGGIRPDSATAIVRDRSLQAAPEPSGGTISTSKAFADHAANGITYGFGRKLAAGATSLLQHGNLDFYRFNLEAANDALQRGRAEHPKASISGEIAGAVASPINALLPGSAALKGATVASRAVGAAKAGAVAGGLAGVGNSDGTALDQVKAAGVGAVSGAVGGALLSPVVSKVTSALTRRPLPPAAGVLIPAMQQAETTPGALAANPPDMLADVLPDLTRTVRSMSTQARSKVIDPALATRRLAQLPDITAKLEQGLGVPRGNLTQSVDDIVAQRATEAAPLYESAYAAPDVIDPDVLETFKLPAFKSAYATAQRIAETEGNPLPPLPTAENPGGIPVRGLDLVKRGLNDVIDSGLRGGNMGRAEARALQGRLTSMLEKVDAAAPEYKTARAAFAGKSALIDAAEAGREFSKTADTEIAANLARMGPSEQALYRRGAMDDIITKLEAARGSATSRKDLLATFYSSVGGHKKVRALFADQAAFDTFDKSMERIAKGNESYNFIVGGSQTADKAAAQAAFGDADAARTVANFAKEPYKASKTALADALERAIRVGSRKTAEKTAPQLVATGPDLAAILDALQKAERYAPADAALRKRGAAGVGAAFGSLGARGLLSP